MEIENEIHFLFKWKIYDNSRKVLFDNIHNTYQNFEHLDHIEKFIFLMSQEDRHITEAL